jgi:DMSO/TMAO reductase YedYZ molybdopterin-dependent catalytic subunit
MLKKSVLIAVIMCVIMTLGFTACSKSNPVSTSSSSTNTPSTSPAPGGEVEATEFMGVQLTPIDKQLNNSLQGIVHIDRTAYRLTVDGLADAPLSLSYDDLLAYLQISRLMDLNCVEGWNFTAKWTGPELTAIFKNAQVKPEAKIAIFYTPEGPYGFTSLDLSYIQEKNILLALKLNDLTLPPDRGFPCQVVAESKYGYKWAKWVTRIELSSDTSFRGYWEKGGFNNNADINGPKTEH